MVIVIIRVSLYIVIPKKAIFIHIKHNVTKKIFCYILSTLSVGNGLTITIYTQKALGQRDGFNIELSQ